jgi:hypothetical protein
MNTTMGLSEKAIAFNLPPALAGGRRSNQVALAKQKKYQHPLEL